MKPVMIFLLLFFTYISPAFAHGGVDDEAQAPVASSKTASNPVNVNLTPVSIDKAINTSDGQYKLHITQTPGEAHQNQEVNFDFEISEVVEGSFGGNPPVEDAKLKAQINEDNSAPEEVDVSKKKPAGTYEFSYIFHKGANYHITLNLVTSDNRKASLDFPVTVIPKPVNYKVYGILFLILVLIIFAIFLFYRRASATLPRDEAIRKTGVFSLVSLIIMIISFILLPKLIPDESVQVAENTNVQTEPDNLIQVPKETQLLFNIRTQEAGNSKIISGLTVTGVVKAPPQSRADVTVPFGGRIQLNNLSVGSYVNKGQTIGSVEQILTVPETATIQSILADLRSRVADLQSRIEPAKAKIKAAQAEFERSKIDLKAKSAQLQVQIEQSRAKVEAAKIELDRAQKLYNIGAAPLKRVQEAQFQVRNNELELIGAQKQKTYNLGSESIKMVRDARLQVKLNEQELISAQKQVEVIQSSQNQLSVKRKSFPLIAPISGAISEIRSTTGSQIESGKPVITIINLSQLWIEAQVFEKDLNAITSGTEATFKLAAFPNDIFAIGPKGPNRLLTIGTSVNPEKRTIPVIYDITNASNKIREGMFAEITIDTSGDKKVISVPKDSVTEDNGKKFVYVFKGGEAFEKRQVSTGSEGMKDIEIPEGIKSGERVVTEGIYQLKSVTAGKK